MNIQDTLQNPHMKKYRKIAFETTRPVTGDSFFGRTKELEQSEIKLKHQQSILITGESRIGKTSLLLELVLRAREWPINAKVIATDLGDCRDTESIFRQLQKELLPTQNRNSSTKAIHDLTKSIEKSPRPIIAFLNDFDALLRLSPDSEQYGMFIKSLIDAGHTAVCGSAQGASFIDNSGKTIPFPLVSYFSEISLKGFTKVEARHFLKTASMRSGDELNSKELTLIITLIGLTPHSLQNVGFNIFSNPEFIGSKGEKRLKVITDCIKEFAWLRHNYFLERISDDTTFSNKLLNKLVRIAHDKKEREDPELYYLIKRGFLTEGKEPLEYQGSLFREFLRSIPLAESKGSSIKDKIAKAGSVALDAAIKAAVGLAFS